MADLRVGLCGVELKNPVIPAAGTFGFGREFNEIYDISVLGAVATRGLTLLPRTGNPAPRIAESHGVVLSAVGLENPGVEHFIAHDLPWLREKTRVIANVAGTTFGEYGQICKRLNGLVDFIELDLFSAAGAVSASVEEITRVAKDNCPDTPLIVKLSPDAESIPAHARAAERGGADCLSLVNHFTGLAIDAERRRPILAANKGGVSGAGIKPIALRMVYEASRAVRIPVIGMGGITCGIDAVEFLMAGASAVQVGVQNFTDTRACPKIIDELASWCDSHGVEKVSSLTGTLRMN